MLSAITETIIETIRSSEKVTLATPSTLSYSAH
nr:hypothetical protein [Acaryochloris marina]